METTSKKDDFASIVTFLIFECVALASFCLGGVATVFQYVGFGVSILAFAFAAKNIDKKEIGSLVLIGAPVIILGALCAFGKLFGGFSYFGSNLGVFLAIPGFFLLGISSRRIKGFNVETALLCIGVGAAILVLVGLFSTWVQYGFFYTLLYKNTPNYYYNGALYDVTNEMSWLSGLKLNEVSIKYAGIFGVSLCAAIPALMFISPKKDTRKFIIVAAIGLVGILSIVTIVNVVALIFLIPIVIVAVLYKFGINNSEVRKGTKTGLLILFGFIAVFLLVAVINALVPAVQNMTSTKPILDRIFNSNRIMKPFNEVLQCTFKSYNLLGFPLYAPGDTQMMNETVIYTNTGNFVLEITKEGGLFALLAMLMILVVSAISVTKYIGKSKDSNAIKVAVVSLLVGFTFYCLFNWDINPFTHSGEYASFSRSFPILIILFVLGLTYYPVLMKDEPLFESLRLVKEEVKVKKEVQYIDEDYVFTSSDEDEKDEK